MAVEYRLDGPASKVKFGIFVGGGMPPVYAHSNVGNAGAPGPRDHTAVGARFHQVVFHPRLPDGAGTYRFGSELDWMALDNSVCSQGTVHVADATTQANGTAYRLAA